MIWNKKQLKDTIGVENSGITEPLTPNLIYLLRNLKIYLKNDFLYGFGTREHLEQRLRMRSRFSS